MPRYTRQDSEQTLREGLAEYRALNPALLDPDEMPDDVAALFRQHDAGHVVFGCDTTLRGETLIDMWTIFGTTAGLRAFLDYLEHPEVNQIFRDSGYFRIAIAFFRTVPDVVRVIVRSRRLRAKWPWQDYAAYLDRPLDELRREHGVAVV